MLKRIKSIQNVGKFKSCKPAAAEFGKITFIYGLNTYGKSTLGDIFSSLRTGKTSAIKARKTIPDDDSKQEITLSFLPEGKNESNVVYSSYSWQNKLPIDVNLHVFDDSFYHDNLFSARQFTRATKEAFSSFVLGEKGVSKAQEISEKNKRKGDLTREAGKLKKNVFNEVSDLAEFLNSAPEENLLELESKIASLRTEYVELRKQKSTSAKILSRKQFQSISWNNETGVELDALNVALGSSLKPHHEAARNAVGEHIINHFSTDRGAEAWLRQGLSYRKGENCQFCGQYLTFEALDLLSLYEQTFDASYKDNARDVSQRLSVAQTKLKRAFANSLRLELEGNKEAIVSYPELEGGEYFVKLAEVLCKVSDELSVALLRWDTTLQPLLEEISKLIKRKREVPQDPLPPVDGNEITSLEANIKYLCKRYNALALDLNVVIANFKEQINAQTIDSKISNKEIEGRLIERKILRIKLKDQCDELNSINKELQRLRTEIPRMNSQLREEQSDFLKSYYLNLNRHFSRFGSEDFELSKGEDISGHTPVFYLRVKFRGFEVSEKNLEQIFSESDRRALALSVFWAGITCLDETERKKAVVVLDDPITSFDCNRMSLAHQEIYDLSLTTRQIIVLSHYDQAVTAYLNVFKNQAAVRLLSIVKNKNSSDLEVLDIDSFVSGEHEKKRELIFKFIYGETNSHSAGDLRVFLEQEISFRFAQQIKATKIFESNLSDRISKLRDHGVISMQVAQEADKWRLVLNPTHHTWQENNVEDQRSVARQFMDFVFKELIPA
ncbi:UNVERIFIED_ORG: wobble nucleotide-excising tRNase [Pseudomonas psychrophila]